MAGEELEARIEVALGPGGRLAAAIPGFVHRPQQHEMALAVARAIEEKAVLLAEAGTGTGKTFAYLLPALLSGRKVIVSTGTKTLQDQLFHRDLPRLKDALKIPVRTALLKGRQNYVCLYHLERNLAHGRFTTAEDAALLRRIARFAQHTTSGDKAECADVPEASFVWTFATSSRDNCLGQDCPHWQECFLMKARRAAQEAECVVVNHHLFFSDLVLRDEGVGGLLPEADLVVFDEAHQLPELAAVFFGESLASTQCFELVRDARVEALVSAPDFRPLREAIDAFDKAVKDLRLSLPAETVRWPRQQALEQAAGFESALQTLTASAAALREALASQQERSEDLQRLAARAEALERLLAQWGEGEERFVHWVEAVGTRLALHRTPIEAGPAFSRLIGGGERAWVMTSATLAVAGSFAHFRRDLGLFEEEFPVREGIWSSPFDYRQRALLLVPREIPEPGSPQHLPMVESLSERLIRAAEGRAFVLCTSLKAMQRLGEGLRSRLGDDYTVLMQGEGARHALLERFRATPRAVLVGSQSFWEGVDVAGEALSLVIIDKLPFAPPDDPVLAARIERLRKAGQSPFALLQLPRATIQLKQGAGRLIRSESDRGVLCICDPRMVTRGYGKILWSSLPPMRRTREVRRAEDFLGTIAKMTARADAASNQGADAPTEDIGSRGET
ncbi:MAG: ATP-dependent DNA helicase [Tepidiphilus sp.]|jgi:ATP-dependent DNA helicase DinG|nr:ATP-dependent DNA helicase [Tepidiphilus sp.]MDD3432693.1 ATP-dependent DNA helicase [Tepidiphilus sp.]